MCPKQEHISLDNDARLRFWRQMARIDGTFTRGPVRANLHLEVEPTSAHFRSRHESESRPVEVGPSSAREYPLPWVEQRVKLLEWNAEARQRLGLLRESA